MKITKIKNELEKLKIDAILIAPSEELRLILGYSPMAISRFQGLFILKTGEIFYICNILNYFELKKNFGEKLEIFSWSDEESYAEKVKEIFENKNLIGKKILVNSNVLAKHIIDIGELTKVEFFNGDKFLINQRIIKNKEEILKLKKACEITDKSFKEILKYIKVGVTELELKTKLKEIIKEKGGIPRNPVVSFGENTAYPHYIGEKGILKEKDIILIDFGCIYDGFNSDMTRTIFVGDITEEERKIYNIVLNANLIAEKNIKEGLEIKKLDEYARNHIQEFGYGKYFITRLGHGIGLSLHEEPEISLLNKRKLEKGMTFTVEPGIYIPEKFGIRIEDDIALTDEGVELLTKTPKEIIIL